MDPIELKITNINKHFSQPIVSDKVNEIASRFSPEEKTKIAKAAKQFESLLTSMMLKSMTATTNGMFGEDSLGGDYFDTIFESQLADHITKGKGMGVADVLFKKLTGEVMTPDLKLNLKSINPLREKPKISLNNLERSSVINPSNQSLNRLSRFENIITEASDKFGIDKNLIRSVILAESAANDKAISTAKAKGLMQLIDSTAKDMGVRNVWDPRENIMGGTKYLAGLLRQYNGDVKLALAGYNAGPGNVQKYEGIPPFEETKNYITRVMGYFNHLNSL
jgi:soluble lytic murein transglycosylase-like protein